jgi:hypothetical protein
LPVDEALRFKIEVTLGPVRGLDVGKMSLTCRQAPEAEIARGGVLAASAQGGDSIATIEAGAKGTYLGRDVRHSIQVRWFAGTRPRIELVESLRGSRISNRYLRVGELDGRWRLEYRKDGHCRGCEGRAHFTDGFLPWSKASHCDDCERLEHRVWRDPRYLDVPPDAVDIVSALYLARAFLRGPEPSTSLSLVNKDELWTVGLKRGGAARISTPAGEFDCVRLLIGPEIASGDGPRGDARTRFEALFGLHGDINVWVDRERGFPVVVEGKAPFGPLDVHVKASLTSYHGS